MRSVLALAIALSFGVLPVVHNVCGPECEMGEARVLAASGAAAGGLAPQDPEAECPLHPAEEQAPARESDGCTHDHGTVQEAPESPSAVSPSVPLSLNVPVAAFSSTWRDIMTAYRRHDLGSPPVERTPRLLSIRV
jgi:hypothetical protein